MTDPHVPRRRRRGALVVLVAIVALGCLALGWWQWDRFSAVGGTYQNLGYALQWPLFAVVSVYAYRKFVRLESGDEPAQPPEVEPTELPADLLPSRPTAGKPGPDAEMSDYNAYLAALAEHDASRSNHR